MNCCAMLLPQCCGVMGFSCLKRKMAVRPLSFSRRMKQRTGSVGDELLGKAAEALELVPAPSIWDDLVSHLGRTLKVDWVFIAKIHPGAETRLRTLAARHRGQLVENFEYQLSSPFDD